MESNHSRNIYILQAKQAGKTLQELADELHLTRSRIHQIVRAGHPQGKTALLLAGSEALMPTTRALLARHGYSTRPAVIQAVQNGVLHAGCFFGMGEKRFLEIQKWCE